MLHFTHEGAHMYKENYLKNVLQSISLFFIVNQ